MQNAGSLVKYQTPILINTVGGRNNKKATKKAGNADKQIVQTEDILNSILPPREWTEGTRVWVQYVSTTPATRLDIVSLQQHLDQQLLSRHARETGICPVREELYGQCFDELIRQITINCAERGVLLVRVRDEARMAIAAYMTLYESSIANGIRKALMAHQKISELDAKLRLLTATKAELSYQAEHLKQTIATAKINMLEKREAEEKAFSEEAERIQRNNEHLKASLESFLSAPKK